MYFAEIFKSRVFIRSLQHCVPLTNSFCCLLSWYTLPYYVLLYCCSHCRNSASL